LLAAVLHILRPIAPQRPNLLAKSLLFQGKLISPRFDDRPVGISTGEIGKYLTVLGFVGDIANKKWRHASAAVISNYEIYFMYFEILQLQQLTRQYFPPAAHSTQ
jgi:hypothetical protein